MDINERIDLEKRLAEYEGPDKVVSSMELAEKFAAQGGPDKRFKTGFNALDEGIEGMEPGEVIVISGPTGNGKTFLADTIVRSLRGSSVFSVFFTYEVTPKKFVQWHNEPGSVVFLPSQHKPQDLEWIKNRIWESKLKYGADVAVIDHLHYLIPLDSRENFSLRVGHTMRTLKQIALELNVVVILLCHITKIPLGEEPSISHLRDSSMVGQEADTVLMVWRRFDVDENGSPLETMNGGLATVKIEKCRRTGAMNRRIKIKRDGIRLVESLNEPEKKDAKRKSVEQSFSTGSQSSWMD